MLKNKRILVTGGAGFVGSHLVDRLSLENEVIVVDNLSPDSLSNLEQSKDRITFVKGDILDKALIKDIVSHVEYIFHLAANVGNIKSIEDPYFDMNVNIEGTLNLLEACLNSSIRKFIYSSSAAIYGEAKYLPINEEHPLNPESPYAVSKLAAEKYCFAFHKVHGVPTTSLRYFNIYGPRQASSEYANVIPIFLSRISEEKPLTIFGDGTQTRDFVNVKDVVTANILAAQNEGVSGIFNIGDGNAITINELAQLVIDIAQSTIKPIYAPPRKGEVLHSWADISAARKSFGFNPSVNIRDYLQECIECLKQGGF